LRWGDLRNGRIRRALAIAALVEIVADGVFPRSSAVRVDIFILGQVEGLDERLAEKAKSGSGSGFDVALSDGGEEASQSETDIARGHIFAREKKREVFADFFASESLRFLACVEGAEIRMAVAAWSVAAAAIGERERKEGRAVLCTCDRRAVNGVVCRHGSLLREDFGIFRGNLAEARRTSERG
jgi:hypothetical protein